MYLNLSHLNLEELIEKFLNINNPSILECEQEKYSIIKEICYRLNKELNHPHLISKTKEATENQIFKKWIFNFIAITGLFRHATSSYLYGISLLGLIPGIGENALFICSLIYTFLDSLIFFAFELSFIKMMLNLENTKDNLTLEIYLYEKQIKVISHIQYLLSTKSSEQIEKNHLESYKLLCELFVKNILEKIQTFENLKPSIYIEVLKNIVLGFGMFSKIAAGYFMANALLINIFPSIINTPIGISFILLTILANIGFFYCLGTSSISNLVNPNEEALKKLKISFDQFKTKNQFFSQHCFNNFEENILENRL